MAERIVLTVIDCVRDGVLTTEILSTAEGASFVNDGRTFLYMLNAATACTITIKTPGTIDGLAVDELTYVVPIDATVPSMIGPFPPSIYNQSDGTVHVTPSNPATFYYAAVRVTI